MGTQKLNITFHNPNTVEDMARVLIKISAEIAKTSVSNFLLHNEESVYIQSTTLDNHHNLAKNQEEQA